MILYLFLSAISKSSPRTNQGKVKDKIQVEKDSIKWKRQLGPRKTILNYKGKGAA
jgi:hypothetical protein